MTGRSPAGPGAQPSPPRETPPGDQAGLSESFARGEDGSLARVYREHAPLVFGIASRAVGPAEAEDVAQAVFVSAWRGRATYDPSRGTLAGWLVGITRHRVADALSARRRRGEVLVEEVDPLAVPGAVGEGATGHDQAVSDRVTVLGAMDELVEPRRTVVALAFFEEMTHREISDTTGLPLGTVKSHLRRALLHLRSLLEDPIHASEPRLDLTSPAARAPAAASTAVPPGPAGRAGSRADGGQP